MRRCRPRTGGATSHRWGIRNQMDLGQPGSSTSMDRVGGRLDGVPDTRLRNLLLEALGCLLQPRTPSACSRLRLYNQRQPCVDRRKT